VYAVGHLEHLLALKLNLGRLAEVDAGRRVEAQTGMAVLVVVPTEETLAERACILN
jgi:hypothetical protein